MESVLSSGHCEDHPTTRADCIYGGPKEVVVAATRFLDAWLVKRNLDEASSYLSSKCGECVKLNPDVDEQEPETAEDVQVQLKRALRRVTVITGIVKHLDKAIAAPKPNHEDIKVVKHENSDAFSLVAIPDYMASALDCAARIRRQPVGFTAPSGENHYGNYYALGLKLVTAGEDSGVLWTVWAREGTKWKVVSYTVLAP